MTSVEKVAGNRSLIAEDAHMPVSLRIHRQTLPTNVAAHTIRYCVGPYHRCREVHAFARPLDESHGHHGINGETPAEHMAMPSTIGKGHATYAVSHPASPSLHTHLIASSPSAYRRSSLSDRLLSSSSRPRDLCLSWSGLPRRSLSRRSR
mmetsp:Transcript_33190/g.95758  ORF Transcript_33190/g.95758 Transcript_33190/m.95758 type:complete len:150 (-) Transcript_33190:856-1305(-)